MKRANVLSGLAVDRATGLRTDPVRLAEAWGRPETRVLPVWRSKHIVVSEQPSRVAFVGPDRFRDRDRDNAILLGQVDGATFFAVDVSEVDEPLDELGLDDVHAIMGLREVAPLLSQSDGALLAYANGMISWHRRHRFGCNSHTDTAGSLPTAYRHDIVESRNLRLVGMCEQGPGSLEAIALHESSEG